MKSNFGQILSSRTFSWQRNAKSFFYFSGKKGKIISIRGIEKTLFIGITIVQLESIIAVAFPTVYKNL